MRKFGWNCFSIGSRYIHVFLFQPGNYYGGPGGAGPGGPPVEHDEFGRDRFPPGGPQDRRRFPTPPERRFADAQMFRGRGRDMRGYHR